MIDCPDGYIPFEGKCPYCDSDFVDYRPTGPQMCVYCITCGRFIKNASKDNSNKRAANWRKSINERDRYTWQECGKVLDTKHLDAHHKMPVWFMKELQYDIDNGITLCKQCHQALHGSGGTIRKINKEDK